MRLVKRPGKEQSKTEVRKGPQESSPQTETQVHQTSEQRATQNPAFQRLTSTINDINKDNKQR